MSLSKILELVRLLLSLLGFVQRGTGAAPAPTKPPVVVPGPATPTPNPTGSVPSFPMPGRKPPAPPRNPAAPVSTDLTWPIALEAVELIKESESLHDGDLTRVGLQAKLDPVGIATVGWGHAAVDPETGKFLRGRAGVARANEIYGDMTVDQAEALLQADILQATQQIDHAVTVPLNVNEMGALTSLVFNIGIGAFRDSTLLRKLNAGDHVGAAAQFDVWIKGTDQHTGEKVTLPGLVTRRAKERKLFER